MPEQLLPPLIGYVLAEVVDACDAAGIDDDVDLADVLPVMYRITMGSPCDPERHAPAAAAAAAAA